MFRHGVPTGNRHMPPFVLPSRTSKTLCRTNELDIHAWLRFTLPSKSRLHPRNCHPTCVSYQIPHAGLHAAVGRSVHERTDNARTILAAFLQSGETSAND